MQFVEANGAKIPAVGFGTLFLKQALCLDMVTAALQAGYRYIDTAQMYGNEREVGEGLRASGVEREQVFITTKVWWDRLTPAMFQRSVEDSLRNLGLAVVDLLLIHWNNPQVALRDSIGALCRAKRVGLARHVGVANFTIPLIEEAVGVTSEPLVTNQIELHPYIDQNKVVAVCRKHGLSITAYCPLARGQVPADKTLTHIGKAHGRSASQIALRYLVQQGHSVIPRTSSPDHLAENLHVFDFTLSQAEMDAIDALKRVNGRIVNPPHAPKWDS